MTIRRMVARMAAMSVAAALTISLCGCGNIGTLSFSLGGETILSGETGAKIENISEIRSKDPANSNPIISNVFCADPTSIEYNGRLYIYGTCDQRQYEIVGADGENTYEHIKSLVMLSTDDMVNYTYHGRINVKEICPWIVASWAPSIVSREEEDGLTHFYMYFSKFFLLDLDFKQFSASFQSHFHS